jgi:hypothetical protein
VDEGGRNNTGVGGDGRCAKTMAMHYWDTTLRALKRPVYGLADDDGFVYTGDAEEPSYKHERKDVQSGGPAWFRFGMGYSMVEVADPAAFSAADVSSAVDRGAFYASTGLELRAEAPAGPGGALLVVHSAAGELVRSTMII